MALPARFALDPAVDFLNHGSFGAVPLELQQVQAEWRKRMEAEPVRFMVRELPAALDAVRAHCAGFLGADPADLVFVRNATGGANAVLQSFPLAEGDEILTTDHRYDAVRNAMSYTASRAGATVREVALPFPVEDPTELHDTVIGALRPETKLLVVDWICSPTALHLPVHDIVRSAHDRGVAVLVDGAHTPGHLEVDLDALGADFWVGNLHKWLCAPRGTALLHVSPRWQEELHPGVISHGYGKGLHAEFDWTGTDDPTGWLTAAAAVDLHEALGGADFREAGHALVQVGRELLAEALETRLPHPDDPAFYGLMATVPLGLPAEAARPIMDRLLLSHGIEVPVVAWREEAWVRISGFAAYNRPEQYERLARVLADEVAAVHG